MANKPEDAHIGPDDNQSADIFSRVNSELLPLINSEGINPRLFPALRLYAYNFFTSHPLPSEEEHRQFNERCVQFNQIEEEYAARNITRCTIGTKIEWFVPTRQSEALTQLKVNVASADEEEPSDSLREIVLPWTHSAYAQAFMLEQLYELGAFSNESAPDGATITLHVNFGIPLDITQGKLEEEQTREAIITMNDALVAAYTSPTRMRNRKTRTPFTSDKETRESKEAFVTRSSPVAYRLELRALEVREALFEDLLDDAQQLTIGAFQWIHTQVEPVLIPVEAEEASVARKVAEKFGEFMQQMKALRSTYQLPENFAHTRTEQQKNHAIELVSNADLIETIRKLVHQTAEEIERFITPEDNKHE